MPIPENKGFSMQFNRKCGWNSICLKFFFKMSGSQHCKLCERLVPSRCLKEHDEGRKHAASKDDGQKESLFKAKLVFAVRKALLIRL